MSAATSTWPVARGLGPLLREIRVWQVDLDLAIPSIGSLVEQLSTDELARAERFHFRRDAIRFVTRRAALRTGLAECLGVAPRAVAFRYGTRGKPELAAPFDRAGLHFNLSHSDRLGFCAVAATRAGRLWRVMRTDRHSRRRCTNRFVDSEGAHGCHATDRNFN